MAIDISPLYDVVQQQINCNIHDGNFAFTPIQPEELTVIFTLVNSKFLTGPKIERKQGGSDKYITEVWSRSIEYVYQLDIYKQMQINSPGVSIAPDFEIEVHTVIDSINSQSPRFSKEHGLGVCVLDNVNFSLETYTTNTVMHRATVTFSILAESIVKFSTNIPRFKCTKITTHELNHAEETLTKQEEITWTQNKSK